ncbi:hypothetical protein C5B42_00715 [Candidatus Cerribacteria bacterium 'Amazon FNV 2010 28 9']|uniref:Uncharacterized protein n=1 Tax=Candidatus Cerribacteria bacterium 'Amazon FNV 2010 28 9' TaxID=2081795 RepID=A0A317JRD3_9BACT|nr:MAG: hypothetical protein C5B42_00715 [Candidatus Cerribacteria bacterium 'Amazon FNV 2010 28 9']
MKNIGGQPSKQIPATDGFLEQLTRLLINQAIGNTYHAPQTSKNRVERLLNTQLVVQKGGGKNDSTVNPANSNFELFKSIPKTSGF